MNTNLPNTFATCNLTHFATEIEELKARAKKHDPKGVSAVLRGMMARPDRQEMIKNFSKPMLFIFGKKDNYIPIEAAEKMLQLNPAIQVLWLENSGHMGFVEEPESSGQAINLFLNSMD